MSRFSKDDWLYAFDFFAGAIFVLVGISVVLSSSGRLGDIVFGLLISLPGALLIVTDYSHRLQGIPYLRLVLRLVTAGFMLVSLFAAFFLGPIH